MSSRKQSPAPNDEGFPWQQLLVLAVCRLGEPIAFVSVVAYIYVYTQDIRHEKENAAFYAGLLVSAFAVAEVATAFFWGKLSDKYGRKPVVLFALAGTAVSNLVFGLAPNYWVALTSRFLGGLLNGNVATMQTMVAEMCKNPDHEPRAYSMIPFNWAVGSIMGAAMGGWLARPADSWPSLFPRGGIFDVYPYLLPNLVATIYLVLAVVIGIIFLQETNDRAVSIFSRQAANRPEITEHTHLLADPLAVDEGEHSRRRPRASSMMAPNEPLTAGTTVDVRRLSFVTTEEAKPLVSNTRCDEAIEDNDPPHKYSKEMIMLIIQLGLMSYHSMAYNTILPPFLVDKPDKVGLDLHGGLGFTLRDVGGFMAMQGLIAIFIQIVVFPPFVAWAGVWDTFFWLTMLAPVSYLIVPFVTLLSHDIVPFAIYADMVLVNFFLIPLYPTLLILLKDATPSMSMLGQVNGLAMAACSGARTIAPPLQGAIYGNGGSGIGYWSTALFSACAGACLIWMRRPQPKEGLKAVSEED